MRDVGQIVRDERFKLVDVLFKHLAHLAAFVRDVPADRQFHKRFRHPDRKVLLNRKRGCVRKHERRIIQHKARSGRTDCPQPAACKGGGVYRFLRYGGGDYIAHYKIHHDVRHKTNEGAQAGKHKRQRQKPSALSRIA